MLLEDVPHQVVLAVDVDLEVRDFEVEFEIEQAEGHPGHVAEQHQLSRPPIGHSDQPVLLSHHRVVLIEILFRVKANAELDFVHQLVQDLFRSALCVNPKQKRVEDRATTASHVDVLYSFAEQLALHGQQVSFIVKNQHFVIPIYLVLSIL